MQVFGTMGEWVMFKETYENGDVCKSSYPPPRTLAPPSRFLFGLYFYVLKVLPLFSDIFVQKIIIVLVLFSSIFVRRIKI